MPHRIVVTCWGSHGDLFPYIGLAKALAARGHDLVVATSENYRPNVEQEGLRFAAVGPTVNPTDRELIARVMDPNKGSEIIVGELLLPKIRETYEQLSAAAHDANLIVSHPITFATPAYAERMGVPWVSTVLAPMLFFSPNDLPVFPTLPAARHLRWLGRGFARALIGLARRATTPWFTPLQRFRAELGLAPTANPLFEGLFSPYGTLALYSRVLGEPQPDWPPNVDLTGFVFYNDPGTLGAELEEFLAAGPPPVVFTLGSSAVGAAGRFYEESAAAADLLGLRAVLLTGGYPQNRPSGPISSNVLLVDHAPHELLFPRARAIVHQGGIGTTGQALKSGRPMIVVPHGHDQPDNAFRVTRLGVARTIYPARYRAARVAAELETLQNDRSFDENAAATAEKVRAERGAEAASEALERILR